ncbi:MAG: ABC transporter permease [Gemmatimonadaceae bacterium]|nr:ABC transporter permease [Gemmatimonadaceae bacterium]
MRLEASIAWRYLRSRKGPRLLSLISVIAMGGVVVGVSALILVLGVMNGLQQDLRDKILIGSPDLRVLTLGEDLVMTDWEPVLQKVQAQPGVTAASSRWRRAGSRSPTSGATCGAATSRWSRPTPTRRS